MPKRFVGRSLELEKLRSFTRNPSQSRLTALYGRRRVGKTRLVLESCGDFRLFRFEGLEGQGSAEQRGHFAKTLYRITGLEAHRVASTGDWEDLLLLLAEHVAANPCVR
jgi:AAA+ ATPase superfamily predicted ATPase